MTAFQQSALLLTLIWLVIVVLRFHRSSTVLIGGLFAIGLYTIFSFASGKVALSEIGLGKPASCLSTIGFSFIGLGVIIAYSPLADRLATRSFEKPPTLDAFSAIQRSKIKLIAGIVAAWTLGGILEELIARGIVLNSIEALFTPWLTKPIAVGFAICIAALGAGFMHYYQGSRAVVIIIQISILFGILFVVSGYNLWVVMISHGLYDTIAFVRFANKKSKYSNLDRE